ncbi:hypothetical protein Bca4012_046495 [Brassica carinata]
MGDEAFTTGGANKATFGFVIERDEAESPLAFYVYRLNHSAAVRAGSRSCVPSDHPLVLIAHEHQTHPSSLPMALSSFCQNGKSIHISRKWALMFRAQGPSKVVGYPLVTSETI